MWHHTHEHAYVICHKTFHVKSSFFYILTFKQEQPSSWIERERGREKNLKTKQMTKKATFQCMQVNKTCCSVGCPSHSTFVTMPFISFGLFVRSFKMFRVHFFLSLSLSGGTVNRGKLHLFALPWARVTWNRRMAWEREKALRCVSLVEMFNCTHICRLPLW